MFEGLVGQLLVGYLGRYVKDIQKEKLKITFWNGLFIWLYSMNNFSFVWIVFLFVELVK